jgi:hypothetical protein
MKYFTSKWFYFEVTAYIQNPRIMAQKRQGSTPTLALTARQGDF